MDTRALPASLLPELLPSLHLLPRSCTAHRHRACRALGVYHSHSAVGSARHKFRCCWLPQNARAYTAITTPQTNLAVSSPRIVTRLARLPCCYERGGMYKCQVRFAPLAAETYSRVLALYPVA